MTASAPKWRIAIPSYHRAQTLKNKTLQLLSKEAIQPWLIDVFVADEQQAEEYKQTLTPGTYGRLIVAVPGMGAVRNFMTAWYAEGQQIVYIDDDITRILYNDGAPVQGLKNLIEVGFQSCAEHNLNLWGLSPVYNKGWMKNEVSLRNMYIIGSLYGVRNCREIRVDMDDHEDKQRTVLFYLRDKGVVRINYASPKTKYYAEPGGMQITRTLAGFNQKAHELQSRFPHLLNIKTHKSGRVNHTFLNGEGL